MSKANELRILAKSVTAISDENLKASLKDYYATVLVSMEIEAKRGGRCFKLNLPFMMSARSKQVFLNMLRDDGFLFSTKHQTDTVTIGW